MNPTRLLTTLALAGSLAMSNAQSTMSSAAATPAPAPALSPTEQTIQDIKNPASWLNWGGDFRARNEYFYNLLTLNAANKLHEQEYLRFRARIWASVKPVDDLSLNARLATEPREWFEPAGYTPMKGHSGYDWNEGVFDNLNAQWRHAFSLPATLTVGRQDITIGDGWLVKDGTPNDGSETVYLDAVRFTLDLKAQHTTIDAIGISQYAKDDGWIPTINNPNRYLGDQNETGAILDIANKCLPAANLDGYFIYKHDDNLGGATGKYGDNASIYTVGGRVSGLLYDHWSYSAEGAYQYGRKQDPNVKFPAPSTAFRSISAYGLNSKVNYLFKDQLNNQLGLAFECLSGDDPKTTGDEMFDVLWGRWPRWSEIGLYGFAAETRVGQEANLYRLGPEWSCVPMKNMNLSASYYALFTPEQTPTREASATLFSNHGNFRGHFIQTVLKYKFTSYLSGHVWGECLFPGDYYAKHDPIPFLRGEFMLTF